MVTPKTEIKAVFIFTEANSSSVRQHWLSRRILMDLVSLHIDGEMKDRGMECV